MKHLSTLVALAFTAIAVPALAETPANLARQHLDAVIAPPSQELEPPTNPERFSSFINFALQPLLRAD